MEDTIEYLVGERIGEILNEAKSRREKHYKTESGYLKQLDEQSRKLVDKLLEDLLEWGYEDVRTAYCAGIEDGVRIGRRVFMV